MLPRRSPLLAHPIGLLCAVVLLLSSCQSPEPIGIKSIPPAPEPDVIDLSQDGVVVLQVRVTPEQDKKFVEHQRNLVWIFDDAGKLLARISVSSTQVAAINDQLKHGTEPGRPHQIKLPSPGDDWKAALRRAAADGTKPDVLLTLAYGPKSGTGISGIAASFRSAANVVN